MPPGAFAKELPGRKETRKTRNCVKGSIWLLRLVGKTAACKIQPWDKHGTSSSSAWEEFPPEFLKSRRSRSGAASGARHSPPPAQQGWGPIRGGQILTDLHPREPNGFSLHPVNHTCQGNHPATPLHAAEPVMDLATRLRYRKSQVNTSIIYWGWHRSPPLIQFSQLAAARTLFS